MKKVKINGVMIEVKDEDVVEGDAPVADPVPAADPTPADPAPATDLSDDEKNEIDEQAKKIGEKIANSFMGGVNLDSAKADKIQKDINKLFDMQNPVDSKLSKILNGKDYVKDVDSLTKEEKIVGFYHALVTNNHVALKALSEGTPADGGYLFPNEFLTELVKELPDINVMRGEVRVIPMKRDVMNVTNLISGPKVVWTAENAAKSTTTARYSQLTLTAYKVAAILYSSDELIEDSDIFDVVSMIISLFGEAIASEEERVIWVGNGTTQPQGIDTAGTITAIACSTPGNGDFDDLIRVHFALPRKYRGGAKFYMNDATMSNIRRLKDSNNNYIVTNFSANGAEQGLSSSILGKTVVISDWVPDNTVFFMDAKKLYFLGDRKRMTVKVSQDTTQAFTQDMTAIRVVSRIGGQVVQPLAGRELTGF